MFNFDMDIFTASNSS